MKIKCPKCKRVYDVSSDVLGGDVECECGASFKAVARLSENKKSGFFKKGCGCIIFLVVLVFAVIVSFKIASGARYNKPSDEDQENTPSKTQELVSKNNEISEFKKETIATHEETKSVDKAIVKSERVSLKMDSSSDDLGYATNVPKSLSPYLSSLSSHDAGNGLAMVDVTLIGCPEDKVELHECILTFMSSLDTNKKKNLRHMNIWIENSTGQVVVTIKVNSKNIDSFSTLENLIKSTDYRNVDKAFSIGPDASNRYNLFSLWDGSCKPLEKAIKKSLKDPSSYKHIETESKIKGSGYMVKTKFSAKNSFGARVVSTASAYVEKDGPVSDFKLIE